MKRKIIAFSLALMIAAISFVVIEAKETKDTANISQGNIDTYGAPNGRDNVVEEFASDQLEVATDIYGVVSDLSEIGGEIIGNIGGDIGLGDIIGGAGEILEGIFGGGSGGIGGNKDDTYGPQDTTGGYITIVPAATDYYTTPDPNLTTSGTDDANLRETVDFGSDVNPYTKPVGELKGGDTGDGVRWMQWIFIYTRYGLRDDGITGVFDEDTMAVVKKFQKEQGLVVDGIVDEEVIDKLEYFYLQTIVSEPATYTPSSNSAPTTMYKAESEDKDTSTAIIVALVSAVWILAIVFIIVLKVAKNKAKNKKASSPKEEPKSENTNEQPTEDKTENISENQ